MRTTASRLPITVPASTTRDFSRVVATSININTDAGGKVSLIAQFDAANDQGELLLGHRFTVRIPDLADAENGSPRLVRALDNINSILGKYYRLQHVEEELARTPSISLKYEPLRISRDAAESDVRQPTTRTLNR